MKVSRKASEAPDDPYVEFTGVWTVAEQKLVRAEATRLQEESGLRLRWYCTYVRIEKGYAYRAWLTSTDRRARASSADELV